MQSWGLQLEQLRRQRKVLQYYIDSTISSEPPELLLRRAEMQGSGLHTPRLIFIVLSIVLSGFGRQSIFSSLSKTVPNRDRFQRWAPRPSDAAWPRRTHRSPRPRKRQAARG